MLDQGMGHAVSVRWPRPWKWPWRIKCASGWLTHFMPREAVHM